MLKINELSVRLSQTDTTLVDSVSLNIEPGSVSLLMGPNGAGKSSLIKGIAGWPDLGVSGSIELDGEPIDALEMYERALKGVFLGHQQPIEVPGVHMVEFLRTAYNLRFPEKKLDPWSFKDIFELVSGSLGLPPTFSDRALNENFSGGEKKKSEILQMLILEPKYALLDEIDSGLDLDSQRVIFDSISTFAKSKKCGVLVITHNPKVLEYSDPDTVHLMIDGKIKESGDRSLAERIISSGYLKND